MKNGTLVRVTATRLGGYDNVDLRGRLSDEVVTTGWVGEVVRPLDAITPGDWHLVSFAIADGKTLYVPCVEPDHVEIIEEAS